MLIINNIKKYGKILVTSVILVSVGIPFYLSMYSLPLKEFLEIDLQYLQNNVVSGKENVSYNNLYGRIFPSEQNAMEDILPRDRLPKIATNDTIRINLTKPTWIRNVSYCFL